MENKVLHVTFTKAQTATSKGGHMLFSGETELRPDIAAYLVDIMGKNCKLIIEPEEGQIPLDHGPDGQAEMTYNEEDEEEMDKARDEDDQGL